MLTLCAFSGCAAPADHSYTQISQEKAKEIMDTQKYELILDVREQEEYYSGHISGATLFPLGEINESSASKMIPEKDSVVLIYCRSGNRSKKAAEKLVEMGYTRIYEFGGITTWPYEIVMK